MNFKQLPVYAEKQKILDMLSRNQVIVVESPTGSGKTTQMPIILHEAGYSQSGMIGVTQPRRIAALSVSEYISKQLKTQVSKTVGYKMRFNDMTSAETKIKIMTDGILLQELKLDPWLSKYSVIIVDEAHERSLNIDFILGLLKRILAERVDFKVIISSATINTDMFSMYFDECPVVKINSETFPVTLIFDPPAIPASTLSTTAESALLEKIASIMDRIIYENRGGATLIFLPGERAIKNCMEKLSGRNFKRLHLIPLYGRLSKEEQERVFNPPPFGKKKVVIATNIAETSITINDIVTVIDSGLAKLNYYNPFSFTSSLEETAISKASCNQRRGRAGRTQDGVCYRLYSRKDFERRPMYTTEEIYRTDLSEVVLRMSELGIFDFENFDFISAPGKKDIIGAVETLNMLSALEPDRSLSKIGKMMCLFPLSPRQSRIIVEAILHFPKSVEEVIIAASFLSARSPFSFPTGKELEARIAHNKFDEPLGDFVSFLTLFRQYYNVQDKATFCKSNYLDERIMAEIANIKEQLEIIVSDMGVPILSGGNIEDYITCIASGMIQFVCVLHGRGVYKSLTADKIFIHPGSCLYKSNPDFIVAGEIVKTSRTYAMSVSPLSKKIVSKIAPEIFNTGSIKKTKKKAILKEQNKSSEKNKKKTNSSDKDEIKIAGEVFKIKKIKGKKHIILPFEKIKKLIDILPNSNESIGVLEQAKGLRGVVEIAGYEILRGEKLGRILNIIQTFDVSIIKQSAWQRNKNFTLPEDMNELMKNINAILRTTIAKQKSRQLGFITMYTDDKNTFWFKTSRGFQTSIYETLASLQSLIDKYSDQFSTGQETQIGALYSKLNNFFN
ncbi:MAG: DEAD/DEAH box helicase [Treponema sp.]|nr:MAG: DEAD/DEAH box helicase [Treponema sp.]